MTDSSRQLRYHLGVLCERYNLAVADKDALDVRLGTPEPYQETSSRVNPKTVYEDESHLVSTDLRALIVEIAAVIGEIRSVEGF